MEVHSRPEYANYCADDGSEMPVDVYMVRKETHGVNMGVFISTIERMAEREAIHSVRKAVEDYGQKGVWPWATYNKLQSFSMLDILNAIPEELLPKAMQPRDGDRQWELVSERNNWKETKHTIAQWAGITDQLIDGAPTFFEALKMWYDLETKPR